jgi:osmotically-inducible protein OsmY
MGLRSATRRMAGLLGAFGVGAAAEYFFLDRRHSARRRNMARERALAVVRRRSRAAVRRARYLEGRAEGVAHKAAHAIPGNGGASEALDDVSLAQKVESVAFRAANVSKAHVSVNAEKGTVYLRGAVPSAADIEALVHAVGEVDGVERVESRLHVAETAI